MTDSNPALAAVRVLLLAPNWLGDAVMFSSLLHYLDQNRILPDGRRLVLDLAVRSAWAPLFRDDPRLDRISHVDRNGRHGGWFGGLKLGKEFRQKNPLAVVLGPPSLRAALAGFMSGAAIRIGYENDGRRFLLTHSRKTPVRGHHHHSREFVQLGEDLLTALGHSKLSLVDDGCLPSLPGCGSFPQESSESSAPWWILAPGATYGSAKSWPLPRVMDFAREVIQERNVRLVLLGDSSASAFADELARGLNIPRETKLKGPAGLVDLTGQTDLPQVVSLLKASQVFVGNDSGLMHLAGALGVPTVGVFGSSNPDWTRPIGSRTLAVVVKGFSCHPCYLKACNQKEFCLDSIPAGDVLQGIDDLLETGN